MPNSRTEKALRHTLHASPLPSGLAVSIRHTCLAIFSILLRHRRCSPEEQGGVADQKIACIQLPRIHRFVERGLPLQMVLPAFPAKSPSVRKVMGRLPDLAEQLALEFLQSLCDQVKAVYPPGARLIICSDGHVFGESIGCSDEDIETYRVTMLEIMAEQEAGDISIFGLGDWFCPAIGVHTADHEAQRTALLDAHGLPVEQVRGILLGSEEGRRQYAGICRFMEEDAAPESGSSSQTALRKRAHAAALQVIRRSWAWAALLEDSHPDALRLSIHPQAPESIKFGIHLSATRDAWMTPWHGVALGNGEQFVLVKRHQAEQMGAWPVDAGTTRAHYRVDDVPLHTFSW